MNIITKEEKMNSALLIESTVLQVQELLPYYTKSYIKESIELLSESDEILSKKKSVFDIIKEKGKALLKKSPGIISNLFRKIVKFNLKAIIAATFYVSAMGHFGITGNPDLQNAVDKLTVICKKDMPDSLEGILKLQREITDQIHLVNTIYKEASESGKDVISNIFDDKIFNETKKEVEESINKKFQRTIKSLGKESLNIGVELGKLSSEFEMVLKEKNTTTTYLNRANKKLMDLILLSQRIKVKNQEESLNKKDSSNEAVLRSYIKSVILESKA